MVAEAYVGCLPHERSEHLLVHVDEPFTVAGLEKDLRLERYGPNH